MSTLARLLAPVDAGARVTLAGLCLPGAVAAAYGRAAWAVLRWTR